MDVKKILKHIIDDEFKEKIIGIGKWEDNVVVCLHNSTVLAVIPEKWFLIDITKIIKKDIATNLIENLLNLDNTVQVYPTPITKEYNKGVCKVFEGKDLTIHIDTKLLGVLFDAKKDTDFTFYTRNDKSPVIVKRGDMIIGAVCPVNLKQGGN